MGVDDLDNGDRYHGRAQRLQRSDGSCRDGGNGLEAVADSLEINDPGMGDVEGDSSFIGGVIMKTRLCLIR